MVFVIRCRNLCDQKSMSARTLSGDHLLLVIPLFSVRLLLSPNGEGKKVKSKEKKKKNPNHFLNIEGADYIQAWARHHKAIFPQKNIPAVFSVLGREHKCLLNTSSRTLFWRKLHSPEFICYGSSFTNGNVKLGWSWYKWDQTFCFRLGCL